MPIYFLLLLVLFEADRLVFILMHRPAGPLPDGWLWGTWLHGLPLDVATACYLTAPLWLCAGVGLWRRWPLLEKVCRVWAAVTAVVLALVWVGDACLYGFWGTRLDGTVWGYLTQPQGAASSVSAAYMAAAAAAFVATAAVAGWLLWHAVRLRAVPPAGWRRRTVLTLGWVVVGGLLFLGIRGGVGKSTANVGRAYWSDIQFLNHAAVNPAFSLFSSLQRTRDYAAEFNVLPEAERARTVASMGYGTPALPPTDTLLTTQRPNVVVIIMEGCGGVFVNAVDSLADPAVTPHLNRLAREGVVFTQCYANSFRTDRGTVSTLSGYLAFPDVSVMKLASKCTRLPSLARSLRTAGYDTEFLYGGDINFTNTNGYLLGTGYERTLGDTHFPAAVRRTHDWGVTDRIAFDTLYARITARPAASARPWHIGFLTLASHEPWGVPYDRIRNDRVANSMAYLDACVGRFTARLRRTPQWANTLIVLLPDHGINYPEGISDTDPRRAHIPVILTGGAVRAPRRIGLLCNQSDIAATLLAQLGIAHSQFRFSRDVLSPSYRPSAVHTWSEGTLLMDATGLSVVSTLSTPPRTIISRPAPSAERERAAKALLQTAYDDLGAL